MSELNEKAVAETEAVKPEKKTRTRKAAAETKEAAPKAAAKKTAAKAAETAEKPKTAKKAAKDPKAAVYIQFAGNEVAAKDILAAAKKAFTKANKGVEIKTIDIYVKPEEGAAYYVVNGVGGEDMKIEL